jgi:hypothetical protein
MTLSLASMAEAVETRPLRYILAGTLTLAWLEVLDAAPDRRTRGMASETAP